METIAERRRRKLIELIERHGIAQIAQLSGGSKAYIDQIVKGTLLPPKNDGTRSPRSLGSLQARKIEEGLNLAPGWLDAEDARPSSGGVVMAEGDVERMFLSLVGLLNSVDELTRIQAEPLLQRLISRQPDSGTIARRLAHLLRPQVSAEHSETVVHQDRSTGVVAVVVNQGHTSDGTSGSAQKEKHSPRSDRGTGAPARVSKVR